MPVRIFSPSQLSTWNTCNLRWYWRYIEGMKVPPGVSAVIGKGAHRSVEANMRRKLAGESMDIEEAKALARDATMEFWQTDDPVVDDEAKVSTAGEAADCAVKLAAVHHGEVAPGIQPVGVEVHKQCDQVLHHDFGLQGYIDILEAGRIRDTKTKGKKPPADLADRGSYADQLTAYSYLANVDNVQLDVLVNTKTPYSMEVPGAKRTPRDRELMLGRFALMARSIEAGIFHPAPGDSWACSQKWCGYFSTCEYGERKAVHVPVSNLTKKTSILDDLDDLG